MPPDDVTENPMSSRFLIPILCAGAIALACGPRAQHEASTPKNNQTVIAQAVSRAAPAFVQQGVPTVHGPNVKSAVTAEFYVRAIDTKIRFALHIVNTGKKRVELTFPSGQTYEFVILDTLGREMWRWGNDRMFTQALRNKTLGGGEALDLEETLEASTLPPGRYLARGTLTSVNYPLSQEIGFTIPGTTVASR
jgi:hypothetical protein